MAVSIIKLFFPSVLVIGCASAGRVEPLGDDLYLVSVRVDVFSSLTTLEDKIHKQAVGLCRGSYESIGGVIIFASSTATIINGRLEDVKSHRLGRKIKCNSV